MNDLNFLSDESVVEVGDDEDDDESEAAKEKKRRNRRMTRKRRAEKEADGKFLPNPT